MDVSAALITVAITVGSLMPAQSVSVPMVSDTPIAVALAASQAPLISSRADDLQGLRRASAFPQSPSARPAMLLPMYASLAVLQGFDIYTTSASLKRGGVEANPLMKPVAGRNVASIMVKAAATAGSIYFTERAWKRNRKGALILMTAINVATAAVVAHNTQAARQR